VTAPANPWVGRSHAELAELARELLMAGHMIDRSGMPHLIGRFGREVMTEVAIGEWMAASPVYTRRMQRLLGFEGETVEVIFKGMQLDVGAPPEFLDFRYTVHDANNGAFHLDHCGALMDVEPMGEEYVEAMCHTIEDPTFDATATATNPRAQVRPVHRPPRVPADRAPHCEWTVTIVPDAKPREVPWQAERMGLSLAAQLPLATCPADLPGDDGWRDYAGPLDQDLVMERFSSTVLAAICDEVALQGQLLARAYLLEVADRTDHDATVEIGTAQATGVAGLDAKRLARALDLPADLDGLARVLEVHPMLGPRTYVDLRVIRPADPSDPEQGLVVQLWPAPATDEADGLTWPALLALPSGDRILESIAICLIPTAVVERVESPGGCLAEWCITMPVGQPPADQPDEVTLTEFSTGATFAFERRG